MAGYGIKQARQEARMSKSHREEEPLCGSCGAPISHSEVLCQQCRLDTLVGPHHEDEETVVMA